MNLLIKRDLIGVDWQEVAGLYWEGMVADETGVSPNAPRPTGSDWENYVRMSRGEFEGSDLICLAYVDGRCVGGGHALTDRARDGAIFGLVVHPQFRRRGIGTRIIRELVNDLGNVSVIVHPSAASEGIFRNLEFKTLKHAMGLRYGE